jgi:spastin
MNPNTNNNAQNNNKNINNYNNQQKQQMQNQNNQNRPPVNPYQEKLRVAYNLFNSAKMDYKNFSYDKALEKFVQVNKVIKETYPYIQNNPNMKQTTDQFHRELTQYLNATENKIAHRFDYRPNPGFGAVNYEENMKREIAQMIQDADSSNKKYNYIQPNNNYSNNNPQINRGPNNNMNNNQRPNNNINNTNNNQKKDDKSIVTNDLRDKILSEIVESKPDVKFDDVVGLVEAKQILKEIIIIPNLRPDLFTGLRSPPRGLLLFGPPGTGKTMIAKAVATECKCTFFSISASSLTSKYLGESEKLVRALFQLAYEMQPSVVFIDEIESILSKRKEDENDAMKRLKTEFLIQFDGVGSSEENRVLIIGATNRPFDLDPAVIRRLPKRVYVGPFNDEDKKGFIKKIITQNKCNISDEEFMKIAKMCNNYSNSDLKELCREAAYEPLRELNSSSLKKVSELRPITFDDFNKAIRKVRGTLTEGILKQLEKWNQDFGALS